MKLTVPNQLVTILLLCATNFGSFLSYPFYGHILGIFISSFPTPPKTVLNIKEFPKAIIIKKIIPIGLLIVKISDLLNNK